MPSDNDVPQVFVGVALSGGGSRAANFSMAVLEQLDELGLLRHVTAISSVSGGSLAAGLYAVHGSSIDWRDAREVLKKDLIKKWVLRLARPDVAMKTVFSNEDRSDVMSDIFDTEIFHGATFGDIGIRGPYRPILLINSTVLYESRNVQFTQRFFESELGSRIDLFPISQAVMASAAFPGVFNSVTLEKFSIAGDPAVEMGGISSLRSFIHLVDGGVSDNFGVKALLDLAKSMAYHSSNRNKNAPAKCFIFLVDSYADGADGRKSNSADPRGVFDYFVDTNFIKAFDVLLKLKRSAYLAGFGLNFSSSFTDGKSFVGDTLFFVRVPGIVKYLVGTESKLTTFEVSDWAQGPDMFSGVTPIVRTVGGRVASGIYHDHSYDELNAFEMPKLICSMWHLNLSGIISIKPYVTGVDGNPQRLERGSESLGRELLTRRAKLKTVVDQIDTNFKLSGPRGCSQQFLQDSIYAAAFAATREDHYSREKVCRWFESAGLAVSNKCYDFQTDLSKSFDVDIVASNDVSENVARRSRSVECAPLSN